MKTSMLALICGAALLVGAARAETPEQENRSDVRCLLAMSVLGQNEQYKQAAAIGSFYFAGRIEGRNPDFDLKLAIRSEAGRLGTQEYAGEIKRCGDLVRAKGEAMMGMAVKPRGVGR